jgi:PIN domain nuclease of toxin-antitoxin system
VGKPLTLLDANALIAVIHGEPAMGRVLGILRAGSAAMTTANIAEVYDRSSRRAGLSCAEVGDLLEPLFEGPLTPIPVDVDLARRAGEIRSVHYHRKSRPISMGDSVLLAAPGPGDEIATSDSGVLAVAAELGIETIELPRSTG